MYRQRWWDLAGGVGVAAIVAALLAGYGSASPAQSGLALACVLLFVAGYIVLARPGFESSAPWRYWAFLAVTAVALGVGTAAVGFLAILQGFAFPLVWILGRTRRHGVIGSIVIAVSVFVGFASGGGWTTDAVVGATATAAFSGIFAIALGLWISSIAEYGEERGRLLAELTAAQAEVEALSRDRGAASERERMARDIHDTLAQTLAGLVILAERAGGQSRDGRTEDAAATIATVEQVARDALAEARGLVARTAAVPHEAAFDAAVTRLVDRFRAHGGAAITLGLPTTTPDLDRDTQVVLLRCLQEALANVSRHAHATSVTVEVAADESEARLVVADDGDGFEVDAQRRGFGLDGMADRVALASGTLRVESQPGRGTRVTVSLPTADSVGVDVATASAVPEPPSADIAIRPVPSAEAASAPEPASGGRA